MNVDPLTNIKRSQETVVVVASERLSEQVSKIVGSKGVRESESRTGTRLVSPGHRPKKKIPTPLQTGFKTDFKKF